MNETLHFLEQHGYWLLAAAILGRQACLPIPANLLLVAAGALAHSRKLDLGATIAVSILTFVIADLAWYEAGRKFGTRVLHFVGGLSNGAAAGMHRATSAFAAHRVRTLLLSKFVIGLDAVSAPLAGSTGLSRPLFVGLDAIGAGLWATCYAALGYIFSNQLDRVATHLERLGTVAVLIVTAAFAFYLLRRLLHWRQFLREFNLARITPEQLQHKLAAGEDILLVDLRPTRRDGAELEAIPGAVRINPHRPREYRDMLVSPAQEIVLYCESPGEFTSARVALALRQRGIEHVHPLAGGLMAWRALGLPVTSSVRAEKTPVDLQQS
jgi:membrane protein DedA with SNARE-associated domain/rhodanese-related sulfurtransferase